MEYDLVRSLTTLITQISSQLPQRVPAAPLELHEASYARVGRLFAEREADIYRVLNAMIAASVTSPRPYKVAPIPREQFELYEAMILTGQIPHEGIQAIIDANPEFAKWYKERAKERF
ncbi:hypothetical protein [Afipia clevelandensis]|uniref:Uncharacterized protein n=1 Tax=Afipia clevelandensis ATCC 49720 TaxID=883079 RepID=K8PNQ8_9BRAD|nr:hypothetical protein [Afipia clevelandensis]EKS40003.1 hypothetical protein HMPREF9696_01015 [Afipia clevelandensis ATCC 49720]